MLMPPKSYVIFSPARTGSTLITYNLIRYADLTVLRTHDPTFLPPHNNFICILSKRENIFEATLSRLLIEKTQETNYYTGKIIEPFEIDVNCFYTTYCQYLDFFNKIDLTPYKKIIEVWFEPLMSDPYYLFKQLGITRETIYNGSIKSPYDYNSIITNIDKLKIITDELHRRPF